MNCTKCGAPMTPMIFSSFCSAECDRPKTSKAVSNSGEGWRKFDTGLCYTEPKPHGRTDGSWYILFYPSGVELSAHDMPQIVRPDGRGLRGWWSIKLPDRDVIDLMKRTHSWDEKSPGWLVETYQKISDEGQLATKLSSRGDNESGMYLFHWVTE